MKEKQSEIDYLKQQLKEKEVQIKAKDETISEFGLKFAKLADQAQQLNLVDKPQIVHKEGDSESESVVTRTEKQSVRKHWWKFWH